MNVVSLIDDGAMSRDRVLRELSRDAADCRADGFNDLAEIIADFRDVIIKNVGHHQPIYAVSATHNGSGKQISLLCYSFLNQNYHLRIGNDFLITKRWPI